MSAARTPVPGDDPAVLERERRSRFRAFVLGVAAPALISLLGAVVLTLWMPRLPERVVRQWDFSGQPTSTMDPAMLWMLPALFTAIGLGIGLWHARAVTADGGYGSDARTAVAMAPAFTLLGWLVILGIAGSQLDRPAPAAPVENPLLTMLVTPALALAVFFAGRAWLPKSTLPKAEPLTPVPLPRSDRQQLAWSARIGFPRLGMIGLALVPAAVFGTALVLGVGRGAGTELVVVAAAALIAVTGVFLVGVWRVTCDRSGLTVRHPLGWPSVRIPIADIDRVRVVRVQGISEYGGFGYRRASGGRTGVILRSGPALEVTRRNGTSFLVTLADAETAASVLESYRRELSGG